jgi:cytoskeletal protein CcmA (bactofilin family)
MPRPTAPAPVTTGVSGARAERSPKPDNAVVNIGTSVVIKGELSGSEDLMVEGLVEGTIQLREHVLTVGPNGRIKAQVFAKSVIVLGEVTGNIAASDKVDIHGSVEGDIVSPRVTIAEGAHFRGSVDMQRKAAPSKPAVATPEPADQEAPEPQADTADQPDDQLIDA